MEGKVELLHQAPRPWQSCGCLDSSSAKTLQQNQTTTQLWKEQDPGVFVRRCALGGHNHSMPLASTTKGLYTELAGQGMVLHP